MAGREEKVSALKGAPKKLMMIAGLCGMAVGSMGLLAVRRSNSTINQTSVVKEAVEEMESNKSVVEMLGDYKVGRVDLTDGWSKALGDRIRLKVPVKGTKRNANLIVFADRSEDSALQLRRIEMVFDNIDGKRLLLLESFDEKVATQPVTKKYDPELRFIKSQK